MITQRRLKEIFEYDSRGAFVSKIRRGKCGPGAVLFGSPDGKGHLQITIDYRVERVHRMLFLWHFGFLPEQIDHINGNGFDNRIENLRSANAEQNSWNKKPLRKGRYKGTYYTKKNDKFRAKIKFNGKQIHIGYFEKEKDAALAYDKKAKELFGDFACTNF